MQSLQDQKSKLGKHSTKALPGRGKTKVRVPEAFGQDEIHLKNADSQNIVDFGAQAADSYVLNQPSSERLCVAVARLRTSAPPQHWPDFEAGFMSRLEQYIRSIQGAPKLSQTEKEQALALGNQTMKALHEAALRVAALAEVGAITPASAQGREQLRHLSAICGAITWICPVEPGAKL